MRKTVALLLLLVFFFLSCATYTISEARDKIVYPEKSEVVTRYNDIIEKELKKDRSKTQIMGFTKLDLLEMTRKKL